MVVVLVAATASTDADADAGIGREEAIGREGGEAGGRVRLRGRHLPGHPCATTALNIPASYEPPFWWVMTASRLAALIIPTRQTRAAVWSSS